MKGSGIKWVWRSKQKPDHVGTVWILTYCKNIDGSRLASSHLVYCNYLLSYFSAYIHNPMVCFQNSSQSRSFRTECIPCYSLSLTLNAFSFHSTKAKVLKRNYKALYDLAPCYLISYHFFLCSLFSVLTIPLVKNIPDSGFTTLSFLYLECFSSKYLYPFSLPLSLLSVRSFPAHSIYNSNCPPYITYISHNLYVFAFLFVCLPLLPVHTHAPWAKRLCFSHCYSPIT